MRVKALDADAGTADSSTRPRSGVPFGNSGVALRGVRRVRRRECFTVNRTFRLPNTATSFDARDATYELGIDEPVARWHRRAVVCERRIAHDNGLTRAVANDNIEVGERLATQPFADRGNIRISTTGHDPRF